MGGSITPEDTERVKTTLSKIRYKDWVLSWEFHDTYFLLWWRFPAPDFSEEDYEYPPTFDTVQVWDSRAHHVPEHATEEQIVRTAFMAVKLAEEHEAAEAFVYNGKKVFDPHKAVV